MKRMLVVLLAFAACHAKDKDEGDDAGVTVTSTTATATATTAPSATKETAEPPPSDPAAFLGRFCGAAGKGDKAYLAAHSGSSAFSSEQGTDPTKCGGRTGKRCKRVMGGMHPEPDFGPVCARIGAQPSLSKATREEGGTVKVRLTDGDLISDLVIERNGNDYRLIKEVIPEKGK